MKDKAEYSFNDLCCIVILVSTNWTLFQNGSWNCLKYFKISVKMQNAQLQYWYTSKRCIWLSITFVNTNAGDNFYKIFCIQLLRIVFLIHVKVLTALVYILTF